ncbi:TPA: methyltransferase domain-containing protein [Candidatus Bathyarchaeota archaeon]|nr:methyltransferase domain-containing protein [Candidatus Bathyarchaeota archaeon]
MKTVKPRRKRHLEMILSRLSLPPKPKLAWESYPLDSESAAEVAYIAGWINKDIQGKSVIDLGCGSGILAISAVLMDAKDVVGIDIDVEAIKVAKLNAEGLGVRVNFIAGDMECIRGSFNTTLMNPPFGSWRTGADVKFLKKAIEISEIIYSLHKRSSSVRDFLSRKIRELGGEVLGIYEIDIVIPRLYNFHHKKRYIVKADLYRISKVKSND